MGKASRRKRQAREGRQTVLAQLRSEGIAQGMRVADTRGPKVSVALGELIKPYAYGDIQVGEYQKLATIGALAWNIAMLPDFMSEDRLQGFLVDAGAAEAASLRALIEDLKERKQQLFPDDQRIIVRTEVREQPDGSFYLAVAADATEEAAAELRR